VTKSEIWWCLEHNGTNRVSILHREVSSRGFAVMWTLEIYCTSTYIRLKNSCEIQYSSVIYLPEGFLCTQFGAVTFLRLEINPVNSSTH
jgi:hypothetical protein